jgi:transcriptional regulator with XRE-family HTH domain
VIAEYENGVAVPDAKIMQKLRAVLNTKLWNGRIVREFFF